MSYGGYGNHYVGSVRYADSSDDEDYRGGRNEGYGGRGYGYRTQSGHTQVRDHRNDYGNTSGGYATDRSGTGQNYSNANNANYRAHRRDHRDDFVEVHTDGACRNNGRHGSQAGYGCFWGDDHPNNRYGPVDGEQTNNRAELTAVFHALRMAYEQDYERIRIVTDSTYVERALNDWIRRWRRNGWRTADGGRVKNQDLFQDIDYLCGKLEVQIVHVPGHSGDYGNDQADQLANMGADGYSNE